MEGWLWVAARCLRCCTVFNGRAACCPLAHYLSWLALPLPCTAGHHPHAAGGLPAAARPGPRLHARIRLGNPGGFLSLHGKCICCRSMPCCAGRCRGACCEARALGCGTACAMICGSSAATATLPQLVLYARWPLDGRRVTALFEEGARRSKEAKCEWCVSSWV